ncbi:MAG TPA: CU044_5270 family protein [Catenuloplanes sp.]|jgi:hypothetical protein
MTSPLRHTLVRALTALGASALTLTACTQPHPASLEHTDRITPSAATAPPSASVPPSAGDRLRHLADTITAQPGDTKDPHTHRYSYLRTQSWDRATAEVARTDETWWRAADGTGRAVTRRLPARRDLTRMPTAAEQRQLAAAEASTDQYPDRGRLSGILAEPLPTDPGVLTAKLFEHQPADTGPQALLWAFCDLARYHYLDRDVRAASLRVLATIDGLTYAGETRDLAGRTALAFRLDSANNRDTILLDPRTGRLLARTQNVTTSPPALFTHAVFLDADRVARPGEVPAP